MSKARLFLREYWINNWFDKSVDGPLVDLEGVAVHSNSMGPPMSY